MPTCGGEFHSHPALCHAEDVWQSCCGGVYTHTHKTPSPPSDMHNSRALLRACREMGRSAACLTRNILVHGGKVRGWRASFLPEKAQFVCAAVCSSAVTRQQSTSYRVFWMSVWNAVRACEGIRTESRTGGVGHMHKGERAAHRSLYTLCVCVFMYMT